jgi:metal-dependent HD superfamily phosphatase/phosphodiesterase
VTDGNPGTEEVLAAEGSDIRYLGPDGETQTLQARRPFALPARHNKRLTRLIDNINQDERLHQLWRCANVNAVDRSNMADHGPVHVRIVANIAIKLSRLLRTGHIGFGVVDQYGLEYDDAEVVIALGVALHDVGMSIHRHEHELYSLMLATDIARHLLQPIYQEPVLTIMVSETLHAVVSHRSDEVTYTTEAGVVKVADALDMTQGRSRIPFSAGAVNIHSLSAAAIERVEISSGREKPICVQVHMNNSAGLFQLDELLKPKIRSSSLAKLVEVDARIESDTEKRLLQVYNL